MRKRRLMVAADQWDGSIEQARAMMLSIVYEKKGFFVHTGTVLKSENQIVQQGDWVVTFSRHHHIILPDEVMQNVLGEV